MSNFTKILIPSGPCISKDKYIAGSITYTCNTTTIYLTKICTESDVLSQKYADTAHTIYAYCGENMPKNKFLKFPNNIIINENRTLLKQLILDGKSRTRNNIIIMQYDYTKIRDSETITETTDSSILQLQSIILEENGMSRKRRPYKPSLEIPYWLASSMFLQHICNYLNLVKWLIDTVRRDKKVRNNFF